MKTEVSAEAGMGLLVVGDAGGGVAVAGATGVFFGDAEAWLRWECRRFAGDLCERFSFKIRRQNRMSPDGDALIPFCESKSLMAR